MSNKHIQKVLKSAFLHDRCHKSCFKESSLKNSWSSKWFDWWQECIQNNKHFKKKSSHSSLEEGKNEIETPKERYISPEKIQQIIDELRLIW